MDLIAPYYKSEEYISHTDSQKGLINKLYRRVRKKTLANKARMIEKASGLKKGKLLDMGSGTGAFAHEMLRRGWEVTGLEPDPSARELAAKNYGLQLGGLENFQQLTQGSFDVITLWHVLEHVHDLHPYMKRLASLLNEKGRLFIAVPNYQSKDATIYQEFWAAYDVPRHLYHFSPRAMKILLEKHGLALITQKPMWYDSFYISMLSSKYKNGKTNLPLSFINGLRSNFHAMGNVEKCSSVIYIAGKF